MNISLYRCKYCCFCAHYHVSSCNIVGKYPYAVYASIGKLSFCDSFVMSESQICTCNMYHATCKLCNYYSVVVISSNATERNVTHIMNFPVSGWIDIVHYII